MIIVICGLPGVGKTTLAKELAPMLRAVVLSTDKLRKEIFKRPTYSSRERKYVYDIFLLLAKYLHHAGINCILDATFNKQRSRDQVRKVLGLQKNQIHVVECQCPEDVVISRLYERKDEYSDANLYIYKKMKKIFEPVKGAHIVVNTAYPPKQNAEFVAKQIMERK